MTFWPGPVTCLFNKYAFTIIINKYVGQGSSEDRAVWQTTEDTSPPPAPAAPTCTLGMVIQLLVSQPIQPIISRSWPSEGSQPTSWNLDVCSLIRKPRALANNTNE